MKKAKTLFVLATFLCGGILLGQSSNATITGFVRDSSQAFVPGVTVTATNIRTGIAATIISNESGSYTIQSLLPGTYKLTATLPGFRTHTINDVVLGAGVTARYNFTLEVGQVTSTVEVTATTALVSESSSSIGQVLDQNLVQDLPLVSNNVLDLMKTMAGVRGQGLGEGTTFAGISTGYVNTVRDGLSVQEGRYAAGVGSTTLMNRIWWASSASFCLRWMQKWAAATGRCRSHEIRHQRASRQRRVVCPKLGAGCEHVVQQPAGRSTGCGSRLCPRGSIATRLQ